MNIIETILKKVYHVGLASVRQAYIENVIMPMC